CAGGGGGSTLRPNNATPAIHLTGLYTVRGKSVPPHHPATLCAIAIRQYSCGYNALSCVSANVYTGAGADERRAASGGRTCGKREVIRQNWVGDHSTCPSAPPRSLPAFLLFLRSLFLVPLLLSCLFILPPHFF